MEGNAGEEEEECPVRDTSAQTSFNIQTHTQLAYTHHTHSYTRMPLVLGSKGCSPEGTARQVMTVQYLLGELKALLAGQGNQSTNLSK